MIEEMNIMKSLKKVNPNYNVSKRQIHEKREKKFLIEDHFKNVNSQSMPTFD